MYNIEINQVNLKMQNQEIEKVNIIIKAFEEENVRIVKDDKGILWFCGKDVCGILEIKRYRDTLVKLDDDERVSIKIDTLGGKQNMTFVNESGLYELIFRSKHPEAKQFKKWVKTEVLPSIRKTGKYEMPKQNSQIEDELIKKHQLDNLEKAMKILSLGEGLCERDEMMIKDQVRNITFNQNKIKLLENPEIPLSSRITDHHKIKLTQKINKDLKNFGTIIKAEYLKKHNNPPIKRQQYVDGATRMVNCYYQSDYIEFIDEMIKERYNKS